MIEFTVPGDPTAWARARTRGKVFFTPTAQRNYGSTIALYARGAMRGKQLLVGPVELVVVAVYAWPKTWSQKKKQATLWKTSKPDWDNLGKIVSDNIQGIVIADDALIARAEVQKIYGTRPELRAIARPL
jgi:Holliday junction resolvase RusA-like endonuclease